MTDDRVLRLERTFKAPASLVFAAWSTPEQLKRWYGPGDYPLTFCEMEFRTGGRFSFAMTGPDGVQHPPFSGTWLEVSPEHTIRWTVDTFEEADGVPIFEVTVNLHDHGDGTTTMVLTTVFDTPARKLDQVARGYVDGTRLAHDQLERHLATLQVGR